MYTVYVTVNKTLYIQMFFLFCFKRSNEQQESIQLCQKTKNNIMTVYPDLIKRLQVTHNGLHRIYNVNINIGFQINFYYFFTGRCFAQLSLYCLYLHVTAYLYEYQYRYNIMQYLIYKSLHDHWKHTVNQIVSTIIAGY